MEKIKLSNGQIIEIIPMGISEGDKKRSFSFVSELPYLEIETALKNPDNIASIQYLLESDEVVATYSDCVSLKILSKDLDAGIYTAEFSTDAVERKMVEMQAQIDALTQAQTVN